MNGFTYLLGGVLLWFWAAAGVVVLLLGVVLFCAAGLFALGDYGRRLRSGDRMALACSISALIMFAPLLLACLAR
jgi:hypothetical protein